jgi:hypothetical protein
MDPINLTCPKCGTGWKLIKAGDGPITCPNCKAPIDGSPSVPVPAAPAPVEIRPPLPAPVPTVPTVPAEPPRPAPDVSDADDPGIGVPPRARFPVADVPRRGRHPLVTVAVVLLIIILVPLALVACLFAVCAVMFRGM